MDNYLTDLEVALKENGFSENYINLCIQYCNRLIQNQLPVIFDLDHLCKLLGVSKKYLVKIIFATERFYKTAKIPKKKSGEFREVVIPTNGLMYIQRWILDNVLYNLHISDFSTGFRKEYSIVDNANPHVNKDCILNLDIKDFFPSITFERVFLIFYYHGYTKELSYYLAKLCTLNERLPQGAPSSPYISNIICLKLDKRLSVLASNLGADYSRYADDITISGPKYIKDNINFFESIIIDEGFACNHEKKRTVFRHERQMVTGLVVNDKVKVPKKTKNYLRQQIYYCKRFGVYNNLKWQNCDKSNYKSHLYGLAYYIFMVEEQRGKKFLDELDTIIWEY